jgi:hypothetical protein
MPGYLLHLGATVMCMHAGQAQPMTFSPRVLVKGQPVVTETSIYTIVGCTLPPPTIANGPCVTAQWISASMRIRAEGAPVLLSDSQAICIPTGTGLNVFQTQTSVKGI